MHQLPEQVTALAQRAVACRICFNAKLAGAARVDLAQPRWIGPQYWSSSPRVAIVMLNPGSGAFRSDGADGRFRDLLRGFAKGSVPLQVVLDHQAADIQNWGGGRFKRFFLDDAGLHMDQIALANIAWCATGDNSYPQAMLEECFKRHTQGLIGILRPDLVVLSGTGTYKFENRIRQIVPTARVLRTIHYAHRKGAEAQQSAAAELRRASGR